MCWIQFTHAVRNLQNLQPVSVFCIFQKRWLHTFARCHPPFSLLKSNFSKTFSCLHWANFVSPHPIHLSSTLPCVAGFAKVSKVTMSINLTNAFQFLCDLILYLTLLLTPSLKLFPGLPFFFCFHGCNFSVSLVSSATSDWSLNDA